MCGTEVVIFKAVIGNKDVLELLVVPALNGADRETLKRSPGPGTVVYQSDSDFLILNFSAS